MQPVLIRHAETRDIPGIRDLFASPKVMAGTLQLPYPSLEKWQKRLGELRPDCFSLVAELDGQIVGQLGLEVCAPLRRRHVGSFGIGVMDAFQGRGVGSQLLAAAIDLADNWLNLARLELTVYADNPAAIALYRKFGFVVEGEAINHAFRQGRLVNSLYMARLRPTTI